MHEEFYWNSFYLLKVHLESCPLKVVSCPNENCNKTMTRNNLQAHVTTTCPWRILQCCHCSDLYPARKTKVNVFFFVLLCKLIITKSFEVDHVRKRLPPLPPLLHTLYCVIYLPLWWKTPQLTWRKVSAPTMSEKLLKFGILLAPSAQPFSESALDVPLTSADKGF